MELTLRNGFCELTMDEMQIVDGGVSGGDVAIAIGGVYTAVVGVGATWGTGVVLAVCTNPIVAGSAAVVGVACGIYGVYTCLR